MSDPRAGPLCSAALAFPYDRHKPSCFLPLLCYIVYMSWRSAYTGPVSLCRYSPHPSRGQKPLSLLAVADNSNGCSLHPSRGQRKKRQEANASCLRLSKKWRSHFFDGSKLYSATCWWRNSLREGFFDKLKKIMKLFQSFMILSLKTNGPGHPLLPLRGNSP